MALLAHQKGVVHALPPTYVGLFGAVLLPTCAKIFPAAAGLLPVM
jgi:hypothetical protein